MTTILYAKSLELNKILTAAEADYEREIGTINSQHLFECIDDNCDAQITCANLLRPKVQRKKEPYYIYVSEHSETCVEKIKIEIREREQQALRESRPKRYLSTNIAILSLGKPSKIKLETITSSQNPTNVTGTELHSTSYNSEKNRNNKRPPKLALSTIVQRFIKNEDITIDIENDEIHIRDLFINLDKVKNINELEEEPRIYYGKAWVNPSNAHGFPINFNNEIQAGELIQRPSFMIYLSKIKDEADNGRFSVKRLKHLATSHIEKQQKKKPIIFYIFSLLPPQLDKSGKFLNFFVPELTYIYYPPPQT